MKRIYLPGQKVSTNDARRLAYQRKARVNRLIGDKEFYIQKNMQSIRGYVSDGLVEEAKPLAQNVAKAERDKTRLLKQRLAYERILARIEGRAGLTDDAQADRILAKYLKQECERTHYDEDFADVLDALNEGEVAVSESDEVLDHIQDEHGQVSERAQAIIQEAQIEVSQRKVRAEKVKQEAGEAAQEAV